MKFTLSKDAIPRSNPLAGRFRRVHSTFTIFFQETMIGWKVHLELAIAFFDLFIEECLQLQSKSL